MRAFVILGLGVSLAEFEGASIPLPTIKGRVICADWSHDNPKPDLDLPYDWRLYSHSGGRLVLIFDEGDENIEDRAQTVADGLGGLIDLRGGGYGCNFEIVEVEQIDGVWLPRPHFRADRLWVPEEIVRYGLERLDAVLRNPRLFQAAGYWQTSVDPFSYLGDSVGEVLAEPEGRPASNVERARMEAAIHAAWKAIEALVGGEPPNDESRFQARLAEVGVPTTMPFAYRHEPNSVTVFDRLKTVRSTRDKRAAHGGRTGGSRRITDYDLMIAQEVVRVSVLHAIDFDLAQH